MRLICVVSSWLLVGATNFFTEPPTAKPHFAEPPTAEPPTAQPPTAEPTAEPTASPTAGTPIQSFVSALCVDLPGGNTSNGALLWMWECCGGETQKWSFQDNQLVYLPDTTKCVDLLGGDTTNGNQLGLWDCYNGVSQQWGFDSDAGRIYLASSAHDATKCIQIHGENEGDPIEIWDCDGKENQIWKVGSDFGPTAEPTAEPPPTAMPPTAGTQIQSISSGKCVDLPGGDTSNGALLQTWDCYGGETQQWSFQNNQIMYASDTTKCVDLLGGDTTNGNQLGLWDCYNGESQQWGFDSDTGTIYLASSVRDATKCIRNAGDSGVEIWDCNGVATQIWKIVSKLDDLPVIAV